jgi:hypothetical protein
VTSIGRIASAVALVLALAAPAAQAQTGDALPASAPPEPLPATPAAAVPKAIVPPPEPVPSVPTAAVPAATVPPAAAPIEDAPTIAELLGHDQPDAAEPTLRLYGFADFNATRFIGLSDRWKNVLQQPLTLYVGKLNVYMEAHIAPEWKSLVEVRYLFVPNGSTVPNGYLDPLASTGRYNGVTADYSDSGRPIAWGGISIERAYLEHNFNSFLSVRVGRFLTPWGIWNVDHGSPVIIGPAKPYVIGDGFFPEAQTGFDAFGSMAVGDSTLGYHLTLSNGRGPTEAYQDLDGNKAIGGRLSLKMYFLGELVVGISGYGGTYTDRRQQVDLQTGGLTFFNYERYQELSWATDLQWLWKGLHFQTEAAMQDRVWDNNARPVTGIGEQADVRRFGMYALLGYRLPWLNLMPYGMYSYYDTGDGAAFAGLARAVHELSAGLNVRINPSVVFKLEYSYGTFVGAAPGSYFEDSLQYMASQLAWAF